MLFIFNQSNESKQLNTKQTGESSDGRKVFYNSSLSFLTCRNQSESFYCLRRTGRVTNSHFYLDNSRHNASITQWTEEQAEERRSRLQDFETNVETARGKTLAEWFSFLFILTDARRHMLHHVALVHDGRWSAQIRGLKSPWRGLDRK